MLPIVLQNVYKRENSLALMTRTHSRCGILCLILLSAIVVSSANGRSIEGQVFIVTPGAQAIKLALVQVSVVTRVDMEKHVNDIDIKLRPEQAKADATVAKVKAELEQAQRVSSKANDEVNSGPGSAHSEYWDNLQAYVNAEMRVKNISGRFRDARSHQKELHSAAPYFESLPTPVATSKTDADGRFEMNIPDEGDYVLLAICTREVFNTTEKYFWIVRLKPQDSKVTLSNDNLTSSGSPDSILTTKE